MWKLHSYLHTRSGMVPVPVFGTRKEIEIVMRTEMWCDVCMGSDAFSTLF
jgi:hypothetical protein